MIACEHEKEEIFETVYRVLCIMARTNEGDSWMSYDLSWLLYFRRKLLILQK